MNEFESVTASQIDRLVDGELTSTERRHVLLALHRDEDGWRRLALAFLESQGLRESLRRAPAIREGSMLQRIEPPAVSASRLTGSFVSNRKWQQILAAAVCGMLLFGLGRISVPTSRPSLAAPAHSPVQGDSPPPTYATTVEPQFDERNEEVQVADAERSVAQRTMRLEFEDANGGPAQSVEVAVVETSEITPDELLSAPPLISKNDQRTLLMSGQRVYEDRQLVEVHLNDGRKGVLPISKVHFENLGWDAFQ